MPVRRDERPGTGCRLSCRHRTAVQEYQAERSRQLAAMEHETWNFAGDVALYLQTVTLVTFKAWLLGSARRESDSPPEGWSPWGHLDTAPASV